MKNIKDKLKKKTTAPKITPKLKSTGFMPARASLSGFAVSSVFNFIHLWIRFWRWTRCRNHRRNKCCMYVCMCILIYLHRSAFFLDTLYTPHLIVKRLIRTILFIILYIFTYDYSDLSSPRYSRSKQSRHHCASPSHILPYQVLLRTKNPLD